MCYKVIAGKSGGTWPQRILWTWANWSLYRQIEGSAQDCGNANALAMELPQSHYTDFIMSAMASQITGVWIVCSTVCSDTDQRKHQSPAPLTFVKGMHQWPVNSPHKGPVTQKMLPFDDVIMLMPSKPSKWLLELKTLIVGLGVMNQCTLSYSIHCGLVTSYATEIWVNIGSGNGLLSDGAKPLPEAMLTNDQWGCVAFTC